MASAAPPFEVDGKPASSVLPTVPANTKPSNGTAQLPPYYHANQTMAIAEHPVENKRPLRVICIGAGFSGIYMGIRIPELLRNVSLVIYDKNEGLGGTWLENRYVYSFEPNRGWTEFYATAPEIQQYLVNVAEKYSVPRFVKLQHKVERCAWDAPRGLWKVTVQDLISDQAFEDEAEYVVCARSLLNDYSWPDIEGLRQFDGKVVHSADWDANYDYSNKTVGIIGNGSSAIQIVPRLQKLQGTSLKCFMRSRTWIAQSFGESSLQKLHLDHLAFSEEDKKKYVNTDEKYHSFCKVIVSEGSSVHLLSQNGSAFAEGAREAFTELMKTRLAKKPELAEFLIPQFSVGCRRITPGPGFLEALYEENVEAITQPIQHIDKTGVQLCDGRHVELDVLVCATGFNAAKAPPSEVPMVWLVVV